MNSKQSFNPIIDSNAKVLVLGSIPGEESLRKQQYYANPRNHFWSIIYALFDKEAEPLYEERIKFLLDKGIALWDVIASCERIGSLDANIKNEKLNKIKELLDEYNNIRFIAFNGTKAYDTYIKKINYFANGAILAKKLPSTSPIPGKNIKTFNEKLDEWKIIREFIKE